MNLSRVILLAVAMSAAPLLSGAAEPALKIVSFHTSIKVDVDASGKPVKVEAPTDLPEAIRSYIERRVATWQYAPAHQEGLAVAATTYVGVNACAVPVGEGYRLGLDFVGNGARRANDQAPNPPTYPRTADRSGTNAEFVLILQVDAGGRTSIGEIERAEISGRPGAAEFEPLLRRWARTLKFDLEQVAGNPVPAKVRMRVTFLSQGPSDRKALSDELQAKASASRECQMAQGSDAMLPVAVESVIKVTPVPAS